MSTYRVALSVPQTGPYAGGHSKMWLPILVAISLASWGGIVGAILLFT